MCIVPVTQPPWQSLLQGATEALADRQTSDSKTAVWFSLWTWNGGSALTLSYLVGAAWEFAIPVYRLTTGSPRGFMEENMEYRAHCYRPFSSCMNEVGTVFAFSVLSQMFLL